jgi:protein TonB
MQQKIFLLVLLISIFSASAQAQGNLTDIDKDEIVLVSDDPPVPVGGMAQFYQYLAAELRYPEAAKADEISGKVYVAFVVEKDGSLSDIKIYKGLHPACDREAERVVSNSPPWLPGKVNNAPVRMRLLLPVQFILR